MECKMAGTFSEATEAFIEASPWLGAADMPAVMTLRALAETLDNGNVQAALVAQYGLTHRALLKRAPVASEGHTDPLAAALAAAGG